MRAAATLIIISSVIQALMSASVKLPCPNTACMAAHGAGPWEAQGGGAGVGDGHQGLEPASGVGLEGGRTGALAQLEQTMRPLHITAAVLVLGKEPEVSH